jgi:murein peptide amidase A
VGTISRLFVSTKRRGVRRAALGLLAVPLVMQSCEPACPPAPPRTIEQRLIGTSVQGRPIIAYHVNPNSNGKVVLAIGNIHGDEQTGIEVVDKIRDSATIPADLDVWVIESINPDGVAANTHVNGSGVDLNRNFGPDWQPNNCALNPRYCAGQAAQDQPESQAVAAFILDIKPQMTAWYHGPLHVIDRALTHGVAKPAVLDAYAAQVGYAVATVNCSPTGICVGNATQFGNYNVPGSSAFVIELQTGVAGALSDQGVQKHVNAFFAAAAAA